MPTQKNARLARRPSAGRPKPLDLCSVFLLTPEADLKLDGVSLRAAFKSEGREYLFKVFERVMRPRPGESAEQLARQVSALLPKCPEVPPLLNVIRRAIAGDEAARAEADLAGIWQCWKAGVGAGVSLHRRVAIDHAIEVEDACRAMSTDLQERSFGRVAEAIAADARLRPYATDAALESLAAATTDVAALPARAACLCEFLLSQVARVEAEIQLSPGIRHRPGFGLLLDARSQNQCRPGGNLIRWIQARLGATTLEDLLTLNANSAGPASIDESTLKRWSSDAVFPSGTKLEGLVASILLSRRSTKEVAEAELSFIGVQYWAARRFHKILEIARRIDAVDAASSSPIGWMRLLNDTTPEAWCRRRYPQWVKYWLEKGPTQSLN